MNDRMTAGGGAGVSAPPNARPHGDHTFLALPGEADDWRMLVLYDAVAESGALGALPATAGALAERLHLDAHALRVALDALSVWDIVERNGEDGYSLGAQAPDAELAAGLRQHARMLRSWSTSLVKRLRGEAADGGNGVADPELFIAALGATARRAAPGIVDLCLARFPQARTVIDLGGGHGEYSLEFARRGLRVTLQDLPVMIDVVRRQGRLTAAGVELVAGSFFEDVPAGPFDLAFCAGITHTFDADHNQNLFGRLRPIVPPDGGVAIVTFLRHRRPLADIFAVQMLANSNGGDSHGLEDYDVWLSGAGFRTDLTPVDLPAMPQSIVFAT